MRTTLRTITAVAITALIAVACGTSDGTATPDPTSVPVTATGEPVSTVFAPTSDPAPLQAEPPSTSIATSGPAVAATAVASTVHPTPLITAPEYWLETVESIRVEPESDAAGFDRAAFVHEFRNCGSRGIDPYTGVTYEPWTCDIDYLIDPKELFESGAWAWDADQIRLYSIKDFATIATHYCVNRSKGDSDMAEWSGHITSGVCEGLTMTAEGRCFLAWETAVTKYSYDLSVDQAEKDVLKEILEGCTPTELYDAYLPPSGPTNFQFAEPLSPAEATTYDQHCHRAYTSCLPNLPGDALDCGDLTSDQKPVTVLVTGVDPYRLDRDGDGRGCTS